MNIPATVTVTAQGTAPTPAGSTAALPPVAAASAATPEASTGKPADDAPATGAFNALLASLGLLPPATDAAAAAPEELTDADAGEQAEAVPATDAVQALPPAAAQQPVPTAELTPAWRSDAAMLMASLPPAAAAAAAEQPATAAVVMPSSAALPAAATAQVAMVSAASAPVPAPGNTAAPATRTTRPLSADRSAPLPAALPAAAQAAAAPVASPTPPALAAVLPREAAPVLPPEATAPQAGRRDDTSAAAFALLPAEGSTMAVDATAATSSVTTTTKPVPANGQALLEALGERVQVQIAQRSEQAVIRLDPQAMGSVEIVLRHEAGTLQVQLSASHPDVQRQLQSISEALRQDLSQRQYTDVSVNVAAQQHGEADGRRRQGGQQPQPEQRPGQALAEAERGSTAGAFSMASSLE